MTMIELDFEFTEEGDYSQLPDKYVIASSEQAAHGLILYGRIVCYINDIGFGPGEGAILGFATEMKHTVDRLSKTKAGCARWSDFDSTSYFTMKREDEIVTVFTDDGSQTSVSWQEFYEAFTNFYEMVKQRVFFEQCPELAKNKDVFEWYLKLGHLGCDLPARD